MSIAILALLALILIIVISAIRTDLNTGVLAIAFAYIVGVYFAGLSVNAVSEFLPQQLVLTLVGVTLLFGMAEQNGTLDRLAGFALRVARGNPALLPFMFFLLTFTLSAIGPGNIAAVALIAPIGMAVAANSGISPLIMAIMICTGANAGAFSPVALTGIVNAGLMGQIGLNDSNTIMRIFVSVAALQFGSALLAYLIFGGYRIHQSRVASPHVKPAQHQPFHVSHLITLLAIVSLVIGVALFKIAVVVGAFVLTGLLALFKIGDIQHGLQNLP